MSIATAQNIEEAYELLNAGKHEEVILNFEVDADTFFEIATFFGDKGVMFARTNQQFIIRLK